MKAFLPVFIFKIFIFIVIAPVASMAATPHAQVDASAHRLLSTSKSPVVSLLKPNIVFIFADDMGYGDVKVLNPERGKIPTPHMDALAFDYYFGISASLDMAPYIYIENDRFVGECTTTKAFFRKGPAHEDFEAIDVLDDLAEKAVGYIQKQSGSKSFFAYIALPSPHTPIVLTSEWQGKSSVGSYGDFQMQTDAFVGQIMAAIDAAGLQENTLIIVSSDNGCSKAANIVKLEAQGHYPSAQLESDVERGRSTAGPEAKNDMQKINIWKRAQ